MSRWPRRIGYALMLITLGLALGGKKGWIDAFGPVPVAAVAIISGALAVMLVMTDLMVRGMFAQAAAAAAAEQAEEVMSESADAAMDGERRA